MVNGTLFVGDVHGDAPRLEQALAAAHRWSRRLVLLGDYVNRGPQSREVLDMLCHASRLGHVALLGNHDQMLLDYLDGRLPFVDFATAGGAHTIASYVEAPHGDVRQQLVDAIPSHHVKFVRQLLPYYETPDVFASHAGLDPSDLMDRSPEAVALTGHPELFQTQWRFDKTLICGHYTQHNGTPYLSSRMLCLDTGCGNGGPLTALKWPEREVCQF